MILQRTHFPNSPHYHVCLAHLTLRSVARTPQRGVPTTRDVCQRHDPGNLSLLTSAATKKIQSRFKKKPARTESPRRSVIKQRPNF